MGRNATRAQQAKARVREARLLLLAERQAQDERIEEATVRTVLAWEDVVGPPVSASVTGLLRTGEWSETTSLEGAPPNPAKPHGWGLSMSRSEAFR